MDGAAGRSGVPAGLRLRCATSQDAAAVQQLVRAAYQPYVERIGREPAPMQADYSDLRPPVCAWVLQDGDHLVGVLVCQWAGDHLLVENVAVEATRRGQGLGALLLDRAEQEARAAGLREVRLHTNAAMHENLAYYPRRGYRETHRAAQHGYQRVFFTRDLG